MLDIWDASLAAHGHAEPPGALGGGLDRCGSGVERAANEPAQRNPFGSCADDVLSLAFLPTLVYSLYPSTFPSYVLCWKSEPLSELH